MLIFSKFTVVFRFQQFNFEYSGAAVPPPTRERRRAERAPTKDNSGLLLRAESTTTSTVRGMLEVESVTGTDSRLPGTDQKQAKTKSKLT